MTCKPFDLGNGITGIACSRGRKRAAPCGEPHCTRDHAYLCDYPVTRNGQRGTCDRKLCSAHAVVVGNDLHYCGPHARLSPSPGEGQ
jgi:hypothetical protein